MSRLPALGVLLCSSACQILGIAPIPCATDADCPEQLACDAAELVCVTPPGPVGGEGEGELDVLGPVRAVDDHCGVPVVAGGTDIVVLEVDAAEGGGAALGRMGLLPIDPSPPENFVDIDATCVGVDRNCLLERANGGTIVVTGGETRAPMGARVMHGMTHGVSALRFDLPQPASGTFAFEVIARAPTTTSAILTVIANGNTALQLSSDLDPAGFAFLRLDGQQGSTFIDTEVGGRWFHLLCVVDGARAARSMGHGVMCAVDGGPTLSAGTGEAPGFSGATVSRIDLPMRDGTAIATLAVWSEVSGLPDDPIEAADAVVQAAARRLQAYVGIVAETDLPLSLPGISTSPRLLPLVPDLINSTGETFALVSGRWPRVVADSNAAPGTLLIEPERVDLANGALRGCGVIDREIPGLVSPADAVSAGCSALAANADIPVEIDAPVTLSAVLVHPDTASGTLSFGASGGLTFDCDVDVSGDVLTPLTNGCTVQLQPLAGRGVHRVVVTSAGRATTAIANVSISYTPAAAGAIVWGMQAEQGLTAVTVMQPAVGALADNPVGHAQDLIFWDAERRGVINAARLRLRLTDNLPAGTSSSPLLVSNALGGELQLIGGLEVLDVNDFAATAITVGASQDGDPPVATASGPPATRDGNTLDIVVGTAGQATCSTPSCAAVEAPPGTDFQLTHLGLGGNGEPLSLQTLSMEVTTDGALQLPLQVVMEPRVNGCTEVSNVLIQADLCPDAANDPTCGDVGVIVAASDDQPSPLPGRRARAAPIGSDGTFPLDDDAGYLIELRFRVPGADAEVFALTDDAGDPILRFAAEADAVRIYVPGLSTPVPATVDEWIQLTCALVPPSPPDLPSARAVCFKNAILNPVAEPEVAYGATAATLTVADGVVVDRLRVAEVEASVAQATSFLAAWRFSQAFGIHPVQRREPLFTNALLGGLAYTALNNQLFLVGAGWPRMGVWDGKPALLVEPPLLDVLVDDFSAFTTDDTLSPSSDAGPGPRTTVVAARDATLLHVGLATPGCASVFVQARTGGRVTLSTDEAEPLTATSNSERWRRLVVCAAAGEALGGIRVDVEGDALLALPQLDPLALSSPAVADSRPADGLQLISADLTHAPISVEMELDASVRGDGTIAQLIGGLFSDGVFTNGALRLARRAAPLTGASSLHMEVVALSDDLVPTGVLGDSDLGIPTVGRFRVALRLNALLATAPNGGVVGGFSGTLSADAVALELGATDPGVEGLATAQIAEVAIRPGLR